MHYFIKCKSHSMCSFKHRRHYRKPLHAVSEIFVDYFLLHRLHLHFNRTLVEVREQFLRVPDEKIEFGWQEFLYHHGTNDQDVASAFNHQFICQTSVKCAVYESSDEDVLHNPLGCSAFTFKITCEIKRGEKKYSPVLNVI